MAPPFKTFPWMCGSPLFLALLLCALAALVTVAFMFAEEWYERRPRRPIFSPSAGWMEFALWILWVNGPYFGLALLTCGSQPFW